MPTTPPQPLQQGWATSPAEHSMATSLIQIEAHLKSIRGMLIFFVVMAVLSMLLGFGAFALR
jgi:hypothetical protein